MRLLAVVWSFAVQNKHRLGGLRCYFFPQKKNSDMASFIFVLKHFSADVEPDTMAEEITLMRNMLVAVVEERYSDAGLSSSGF